MTIEQIIKGEYERAPSQVRDYEGYKADKQIRCNHEAGILNARQHLQRKHFDQ